MVLSIKCAHVTKYLLNPLSAIQQTNKRLLSSFRYEQKTTSWVNTTPNYANEANTNVNNCQVCPRSYFTKRSFCSVPELQRDVKPLENIESLRPEEFVEYLHACKISRCFIVKSDDEEGTLLPSHPALEPLADRLAAGDYKFDHHDAIFFAPGVTTDCLLAVFLWRTHRGQGVSYLHQVSINVVQSGIVTETRRVTRGGSGPEAGGVDLKLPGSFADFLSEGNRFSKNLGIKSALAGIWAGGGKGLIAAPGNKRHLDPDFRRLVFRDFGEFLSSLNGCMVAGSGVGSSVQDIDHMFTRTRYLSNLSETIGGTGNPAEYTGLGVMAAMEAAVAFLNMGTLKGKTVVIQGAGFVGEVLISLLLNKGVRHIHLTECNKMRADDIRHRWSHTARGRLTVTKVSFEDKSVFKIPCDIMAPCARERVLNSTTIPLMDVKIVCGAANNPVDPDGDNHQLMVDNGITYVTDVVPNRMSVYMTFTDPRKVMFTSAFGVGEHHFSQGMVSKMVEPYGRMLDDPVINKHFSRDWEHSIYQTTLRILTLAREENITPFCAAFRLGELMSLQDHPIYPGRTRHIIQGLIDTNWHHGDDFWRNLTSISGADMV